MTTGRLVMTLDLRFRLELLRANTALAEGIAVVHPRWSDPVYERLISQLARKHHP